MWVMFSNKVYFDTNNNTVCWLQRKEKKRKEKKEKKKKRKEKKRRVAFQCTGMTWFVAELECCVSFRENAATDELIFRLSGRSFRWRIFCRSCGALFGWKTAAVLHDNFRSTSDCIWVVRHWQIPADVGNGFSC